MGFSSKEEFFAHKRKALEKRLGLNGLPGLNAGSLGVTDADINGERSRATTREYKRKIQV